MKLLTRLKKLIGISICEYTIFYQDQLSIGQITQLSQKMINKFGPTCSPNRISVSRQSCTVTTGSPCLTGNQLKQISDLTLAPSIAEVKSISLDGNQIWPN